MMVCVGMVVLAASLAAQEPAGPVRGGRGDYSGWLAKGVHWLNEGGGNRMLFGASDSLFRLGDGLLGRFPSSLAHPDSRWYGPDPWSFPVRQTYEAEIALPPVVTDKLLVISEWSRPARHIVELRLHLDGVEHVLELGPELVIDDAPVGGFRYGIHGIVRQAGSGQVVQTLSGYGVVALPPGRHVVRLVREGDTLSLR
ncbi:MAG: hypothetical protein KA072_12985 [Thermoanaerobaculaceae bacterium]|nr:hypothetical protein [Thermoanaerobaculaceae bacterium]MDI9621503.1 hypothetical protein [Acidobacteriota bacterium]NLH12429.1 hypothetical protein [Holophagae bacterium]